MDLFSHVLVGKLFQTGARVQSLRDKVIVIAAAFSPDLPVLAVYVLLGHAMHRRFWIAHNVDWVGVRAAHPVWSAMWEVPHSLLFVLLVVVPFVYWMRWPKITIVSYLSHIVLDLFTHTGEWGVKPFYPFGFIVNGFTDAWAWPLSYMCISWTVLMIGIYMVQKTISVRRTTLLPKRTPTDRRRLESVNSDSCSDDPEAMRKQ